MRVGSDDTLRRYDALSSCAPERIRVAVPSRLLPQRPPVAMRTMGAAGRVGVAVRASRPRIGDTRVERARLDGAGVEVVRIMPVLPPAPAADLSAEDALLQAGETSAEVLGLRPAASTPYDDMIAGAAERHRVDPLLLHSIITQESHYRPAVVSAPGARGLMQIMPATGRSLGVADPLQLLDPRANVDAGARLVRQLWSRMGGRLDLVLAAFNAGEGAVRRFGMRVPPYGETRAYVARVQDGYWKLASGAVQAATRRP
ncbi:lytic transglycosylase domain-containing protein [Sphingomonas sp. DT-51]|uniref:lytic transglycosylase domain-containing protein n=1 Tax=Sphingomonas sp. DT-51 TaxID=3396165 RepID=UPI003F53FF13